MGFKPTKQQEEIGNKVLELLSSSDTKPIVISGAAGTGKTTLTGMIINAANKAAMVVSAPTHKAVQVIASKLKKVNTKTLHSLLGFRLDVNLEDFEPNNPKFNQLGDMKLLDYNVCFVDEASMINKPLLKLLLNVAETHNIRLVFIGDEAQLAPVKETKSSVFDLKEAHHFKLEEVIRQVASNYMFELLNYSRNDVLSKQSKLIRYMYANRGKRKYNPTTKEGYGIFSADSKPAIDVFSEQLLKAYQTSENPNDVKYLAYTNDNINIWNSFIRNSLFNNPSDILIPGDILMGYTTIVDEFLNPVIINSDEYQVTEVSDYVNAWELKVHMVQLKSLILNKVTPYLFVIDHTDNDTLVRYTQILYELIERAFASKGKERSKAWVEYYKFKEANLTMINIPNPVTGKIMVSRDLDYGFGVTIHKSQGSTYKSAFINADDIIYDVTRRPRRDINQRNRLLYVGLSRPNTNVQTLI